MPLCYGARDLGFLTRKGIRLVSPDACALSAFLLWSTTLTRTFRMLSGSAPVRPDTTARRRLVWAGFCD